MRKSGRRFSVLVKLSPDMRINQRALWFVKRLIEFKERIIEEMASCCLFTLKWRVPRELQTVKFRHSLRRALSIHVQGLDYDVNTSDGASVGYHADSTTFHEITYTWHAVKEGVYLFQDLGDARSRGDATYVGYISPCLLFWINCLSQTIYHC